MFYKNKGAHIQSFKCRLTKQSLALWNVYLSNQSPTYVCIVRCSYQQARPWIYVWNHTYNPWALPTAWIPHCSLALKHLVSFRNEEAVQGRGMTFGKQRGTVHPPCKVLPSFNSAIKSQNLQPGRNRRWVANQPAKVTFPWGVNKTAGKARELRSRGCSLPQSLPQGLPLMWAEIQVWSRHTAGAARMAFPHSYQLFQAFSTWRCMFIWKK